MTHPALPPLRTNPLLSPGALLLAAISLSIGWGIRGNYGHETGAMLPGALAAIAVCVLSCRVDWHERLPYFACLGALGWGLGGSMSYMQVISYTYSGHRATQYFGFWGLFLIGFLWAAFGVAGTALPAVLNRKNLQELFKPLTLLFGAWAVLYFVELPLTRLVQQHLAARFPEEVFSLENVKQRHELALYWFDSDWIAAAVFLTAILVFDLVDRKFERALWLPVLASVGGMIGYFTQWGMARTGVTGGFEHAFVRHYGDTATYPLHLLDANWPQAFLLLSNFAGVALGVLLGVAVYFFRFGRFRCGSGLLLSMAVGWFAGFLLFPVFLDWRMTPPRGDNWAGIAGMLGGAMLYFVTHRLQAVAKVALIGGAIGGIGFSGIACVEMLLESRGNTYIADVPGLGSAWTEWQTSDSFDDPKLYADLLKNEAFVASYDRFRHWKSANWHSFLEQSYGFVNGLAVVIAMAFLIRYPSPESERTHRLHWPEIVAITVTLPALLYVNMVKNVRDWTNAEAGPPALATPMKAPLIDFSLSAFGWFNLIFGFAAAAMIILMSIHTRRKIAVVPDEWLGRGQLLFFLLLWTFAIGNFGKALSGFGEQRLLTEGVVLVNAVLAMLMILLLPRNDAEVATASTGPSRSLLGAVLFVVVAAAAIPPLEVFAVRSVYGDAYAGARGKNFRFGPKANWKHGPHIKGQPEAPTHW